MHRWNLLVAGAALYIASILLTGCGIYWSNHAIQLPLVFELNDPALFPDDPFVATLQYYAAPVWRAVAWLSRLIPIEQTLVSLFLLERLLLFFAGAKLAYAMAPGSSTAVVFGMAFIAVAPQPLVGDGTIVTDNFEHTGLSIACFLMATAALLQHQRMATAIWFAAGFIANSMYGVYAATYLFPAWVLITEDGSQRRRWLPAVGLALLLCGPVAVWTARAFAHGTADPEIWLTAAKTRFPHHFLPHTWQQHRWIALVVFLLFVPVILRSAMRRRTPSMRASRLVSLNVVWSGVAFLWLAYALFAAYVYELPSMLVMHPVRGTDIWYCLAGISCLSVLGLWLQTSGWGGRYSALVVALSIAAVALPAIAAAYQRAAAQQNVILLRPRAELQELARWARENTGRDRKFLIDPRWEIFRALSRRTVYVTWKDGSAILWDRGFVSEWDRRLRKLNFAVEEFVDPTQQPEHILGAAHNARTDEEALALAREFELDYWIIPAEKQTNLDVAHQTEAFKIVRFSNNSSRL